MEVCNLNTQDEFSLEEIHKIAKQNRLLTMEIELSLKCNYRCRYCYTSPPPPGVKEISYDEIIDVISQAKELGAKKIILLGGEPTIYPHFFDVVDFINNLGMEAEVFTNGSMITSEMAQKLYDRRVRTVVKLNSLRAEKMIMLTGNKKSYEKAISSVNNLLAVGYPDKEHFIGVSTIICRINEDEIVDFWKWLKFRKITPYFEMITPQGEAKDSEWLFVSPQKLEIIFEEIARIDKELYGKEWKIQPPLVGSRCLRHLYSCLVDSYGNVKPCVGIDIPTGNIKEKKLEDIIKGSGIIQELRNYRDNIKGPCRKCENAEHCYGCRGAAYQLTGDPLASDPSCWKNLDKLDRIYKLPYPAKNIIPQKNKMSMIDKLVYLGDRTAEAEMTVKTDNIFLEEAGILSETVYIELMAQAVASINGFRAIQNDENPKRGFIIGVQDVKMSGKAKVGDVLKIHINRTLDLGDVGVIESKILNDNKIIAEGILKIWLDKS